MSRNLKIVLIVTTAVVLGGGGIFLFIMNLLKSSDAYELAMRKLRSSPGAIELLGEPIDDGLFPMGSIETTGASGFADLSISVAGPKASGTLYLVAHKRMKRWTPELLVLEVDGEEVDLLGVGDME